MIREIQVKQNGQSEVAIDVMAERQLLQALADIVDVADYKVVPGMAVIDIPAAFAVFAVMPMD